MSPKDIKPAVDLLTARRATNGYADLKDLCEAVGIDLAAQYSLAEAKDLHESLLRTGRVVIRCEPGRDVEYRWLA